MRFRVTCLPLVVPCLAVCDYLLVWLGRTTPGMGGWVFGWVGGWEGGGGRGMIGDVTLGRGLIKDWPLPKAAKPLATKGRRRQIYCTRLGY